MSNGLKSTRVDYPPVVDRYYSYQSCGSNGWYNTIAVLVQPMTSGPIKHVRLTGVTSRNLAGKATIELPLNAAVLRQLASRLHELAVEVEELERA